MQKLMESFGLDRLSAAERIILTVMSSNQVAARAVPSSRRTPLSSQLSC